MWVIITRRISAQLSSDEENSSEISIYLLACKSPPPPSSLNDKPQYSSEFLGLAWSQNQIKFQKVGYIFFPWDTVTGLKWQQLPLEKTEMFTGILGVYGATVHCQRFKCSRPPVQPWNSGTIYWVRCRGCGLCWEVFTCLSHSPAGEPKIMLGNV